MCRTITVRNMRLKKRLAAGLSGRKGQATIEYVLMLGTILVVLSAFMMAFNKDIVRIFFSFIGMLLGY